jgi:transglutaminase-like putative cysteine protease
VLFVEACRSQGLPARFVSGYWRGIHSQDRREMHAWAEVYLPGAGWRGYDPVPGLAVTDTHVGVRFQIVGGEDAEGVRKFSFFGCRRVFLWII